MQQTFPVTQRLLCKPQFDKVFAGRARLFSKAANLYYLANALPYARLGVITSKRNQKSAVDRNYIRRQCRELFRKDKDLWQGLDIVVVTTRNVKNMSPREQLLCLNQLFRRLAKQELK